MAYLHAKWLSYKYKIPLLYKPFSYSTELVLDDIEYHYSQVDHGELPVIPIMAIGKIFPVSNGPSSIYLCHYFPECQWERLNLKGPHGYPWQYFNVQWSDPGFRRLLRSLIAPKTPLKLLTPPKKTVNIALHCREGGTFDYGDFALFFITKFPPISFYVEGLLRVIELFPQMPLYCYLFTDAERPDLLIAKIQEFISPEVDITFECRTNGNSHNQNVLEDFFSLFQFDILIHPQSNFSLIPSLIHDYAITYSPISGKREEDNTSIDRVKFEINRPLYQKLLLR